MEPNPFVFLICQGIIMKQATPSHETAHQSTNFKPIKFEGQYKKSVYFNNILIVKILMVNTYLFQVSLPKIPFCFISPHTAGHILDQYDCEYYLELIYCIFFTIQQ